MRKKDKRFFFVTILLLNLVFVLVPGVRASLCSIGFETGDFSELDGTSETGQSVTSGEAHHGNYKAVYDSGYGYMWKSFSAQTSVHARWYIKFTTVNYTVDGYVALLGYFAWTGYIQIYCDYKGDVVWSMIDSDWHTMVSSAIVEVNKWYCVEYAQVLNGNDSLYVNDLLVLEGMGPTSGDTGVFYFGCWDDYIGAESFIDCAEIDTAYIGEETTDGANYVSRPKDVSFLWLILLGVPVVIAVIVIMKKWGVT